MNKTICAVLIIIAVVLAAGCSGSQGITPSMPGGAYSGATTTPDAASWERDEYAEGMPAAYGAHAFVIKGIPYIIPGLPQEGETGYVRALKNEYEWLTVTAVNFRPREGASSAQGPSDAFYGFGKNEDKKGIELFGDAYLYNGVSFTAISLDGPHKPRAYAAAYYYKDSYFVHGGSDRQGFLADIIKIGQKNGIRKAAESAAIPARAGHSAVAYRGKIYIAGGRSEKGLMNDVWVSDNGIDFKAATLNASFPARENFVFMAYKDRMFVSGGRGEKGLLNDTWFSVDGVYWARAAADSIYRPREYAASFVTKDYMAITCGRSDTRVYSDIWRAK